MDLHTLYSRSVATWTDRVAAVGPDQWDAATPCTGWSVRDLTNHVTGEDLWTEPLMRGATVEEVGDRFDGDLLGDRPAETARTAAAHAVGVVAETLPEHGVVHLSYGEEKMDEYVHQLAADHLVHAWDLAVAIGGDTRLDPDLVEAVAVWFADKEESYRAAGAVGPRASAYGDPQSELLAGFGRDAHWAMPD